MTDFYESPAVFQMWENLGDFDGNVLRDRFLDQIDRIQDPQLRAIEFCEDVGNVLFALQWSLKEEGKSEGENVYVSRHSPRTLIAHGSFRFQLTVEEEDGFVLRWNNVTWLPFTRNSAVPSFCRGR